MSEGTEFTRRDLEVAIVKKAWDDSAYRERLLQNPKGVFQEELAVLEEGAQLPDTLEVQVLEETSNKLYLVIPRAPSGIEMGELSDEELEAAAGGAMAAGSTATVTW